MKISGDTYEIFKEEITLDLLVDMFFIHVRRKLHRKILEGYCGWDDPSAVTTNNLIEKLKSNLKEGDMIDVAALAALIWNRQDEEKTLGKVIDIQQDEPETVIPLDKFEKIIEDCLLSFQSEIPSVEKIRERLGREILEEENIKKAQNVITIPLKENVITVPLKEKRKHHHYFRGNKRI